MRLSGNKTGLTKHTLIRIIAMLLFLVLIVFGVPQKVNKYFKDKRHYEQLKKVEQINIENNSAIGNTDNNINNYGLVAETNDFYYYIKEMHIHRSDKDFNNEELLINEPINQGKDTINVVKDWIFYRQGAEINRFDIKQEKTETIFRDISFNMHVVGNGVYFVHANDDHKLYKMDVNGRNAEVLHEENIGALSMAIYNNKIYYSYEKNEKGYLERMDLDGKNKELLANILAERIVVEDEYIYFIDLAENQLYRKQLKNGEIEKLSDVKIFSFVKDDKYIFYTLKIPDGKYHKIKGLYRMDINGQNVITLDGESYLHDIGLGITQDWVFYHTSYGSDSEGLIRISKDGSNTVYMNDEDEQH